LLAEARDEDLAGAAGVARAGELAPGFTIFFELGFLAAVRIETKMLARGDGGDGHDVPEVLGREVGDEEIDVVDGVGGAPAGGFDLVAGLGAALGGFDLHAPEVMAGVEDEVVALAVSPGLGDTEAEAGGFGEEGGFRGLAASFASGEANGMELRDDNGMSWHSVIESWEDLPVLTSRRTLG
jgi:hypothetical protein